MTAIQICALIVLIIFVGLTYWAGYRGGLIDGRVEGIDEGKAIQQSDSSETILDLEHSLLHARASRHRSTAHVSPAPEGPTRYRTPEERGMNIDLYTTQTSTALVRTLNSVDTLETNSLCCVAAGIIAHLRNTAEAAIPHEKLRGAATLNATLIAQIRPPAQPMVGCKQAQTSAITQGEA